MFRRIHPKHLYLKCSKKIKNFLLSAKSREFLIFLFFVLMAGFFWLLQTLDNEYETEISIPIRLEDVPEHIVITSEPVSKVEVKVKDRGTVLLNYMLKRRFSPISIEFTEDLSKDNHVKIRTTDIERRILSQLTASTRLISLFPDTIEYYYSSGQSKIVPVKLIGNVTAARQYYISDTIFSPDSVMVYAPASVLDTISVAYTHNLDLSNIIDTITKKVEMAKIRGVKFIPDEIECTFCPDIYTEKTVEVPIIGVNFPYDKVLRTFPSKVNITFRIGVGQFKTVTADDFLVVVSYDELLRSNSDKCTVKLQRVPFNISQISVSPTQVDYLIEQSSFYNQ